MTGLEDHSHSKKRPGFWSLPPPSAEPEGHLPISVLVAPSGDRNAPARSGIGTSHRRGDLEPDDEFGGCSPVEWTNESGAVHGIRHTVQYGSVVQPGSIVNLPECRMTLTCTQL